MATIPLNLLYGEIIEGSNIVEDLDRYREVMPRGNRIEEREREREKERISYERRIKSVKT